MGVSLTQAQYKGGRRSREQCLTLFFFGVLECSLVGLESLHFLEEQWNKAVLFDSNHIQWRGSRSRERYVVTESVAIGDRQPSSLSIAGEKEFTRSGVQEGAMKPTPEPG